MVSWPASFMRAPSQPGSSRRAAAQPSLPRRAHGAALALSCAAWVACIAPAAAQSETAAAAEPRAAAQTVEMELGGRRTRVDWYRPEGTPRGAAIVVHGFTRTRATLSGYGELLAHDGLLVAVPDQPYFADARGNTQAVADLVAALRAGAHGPPLARVVLIGFSAGGLATLLAANAPGVVGVIGLDPVDRPGSQPGLAYAPSVATPVLLLRAPAAACNAYSIAAAWAPALPRLVEDRTIAQANHCDFEWPTDWICRIACGAQDASRAQAIREAVRAQVDRWLPLP